MAKRQKKHRGSPKPRPISWPELQERLADPDYPEAKLLPYVEAHESERIGLGPKLVPTALVTGPAPVTDLRTQAALGLGLLNTWYRLRRLRRFERRLKSDPKMPILLAEGDSWFQYPIWLEDVIDHLSHQYNIHCTSAAGDELDGMVKHREYARYLGELLGNGHEVRAVLISAGGNDIVGKELSGLINKFEAGKPAEWYLDTAEWRKRLARVEAHYRSVIGSIQAIRESMPVLLHCYDYAIPLKKQGFHIPPKDGWLGEPLRKNKIVERDLQAAIVRCMIDAFRDLVGKLAGHGGELPGEYENVYFVQTTGTLTQKGQWADELHPTDGGFKLVTAKFQAVLDSLGI